MKSQNRLLIVGTVPPMIGGVTVHVKRLLQYLDAKGFRYSFVDFKRDKWQVFAHQLFNHQVVHLHFSNSYLRFCIILLLVFLGKRTLFTFHGNLGRYGKFKNLLDICSVRLASIPILINRPSYEAAVQINKYSVLIPAFIPPQEDEYLPDQISAKINALRLSHSVLFSTNAFSRVYDDKGYEIYQILQLIDIFRDIPSRALVIVDPSGNYADHLLEGEMRLPSNILLISEKCSFFEVLKLTDCLLRITTTDGDSLSVKEALYLSKPVIASNVVDRPSQVILTSLNKAEITENIIFFDKAGDPDSTLVDGGEELLILYKSI